VISGLLGKVGWLSLQEIYREICFDGESEIAKK